MHHGAWYRKQKLYAYTQLIEQPRIPRDFEFPTNFMAFDVGAQSNNVRGIPILVFRAFEVAESLNLVDRGFSRCSTFQIASGGYCTRNLITVIL